jgi:hypothetical protein
MTGAFDRYWLTLVGWRAVLTAPEPEERDGCIVHVGLADYVGKGCPRPVCGLPVVRYGLCRKHLRERVRLGGPP